MNSPMVHAKGLLMAGQCLLYKYMASAPEQEHPWPEQLDTKLRVARRRRRRRYREKLGIKLSDLVAAKAEKDQEATATTAATATAAAAAGEAIPAGDGAEGVGASASTSGGSNAVAAEEPGAAGALGSMPEDAEEIDWDPPLDEAEQEELQAAVSVARGLQHECEDTLVQALRVAVSKQASSQSRVRVS